MSVRAYRVNSKDIEQDNSFNLWHDKEIMDILEDNGELDHQTESGGSIVVSVDSLKDIIKAIESDKDYESTIEMLKGDIKWAEKKGDTEVEYECY